VSAASTVMTSRRGRRALAVYFVCFLLFLYLPTTLLIIFSFNSGALPVFPLEGFTTHWYVDAWHTSALRQAFKNSLLVAGGTSLLATSIGVLAAYPLARRRFRGRSVVSAFILVPLVVPYVTLGVALLLLFRKGPIPITLSLWTVLLGHVVISLPYTILLLVPRIASIDVRLEEAAQDLGASGFMTFRRVVLPLIFPAILSALLISFVISIDEYAVASFVVGDSVTYPIYLFSQLRFAERLPLVIAVATAMIVISFLIVVLAEVVRRRGDRRVRLATAG
jgi:spermidine/putrescine transport system permease protein